LSTKTEAKTMTANSSDSQSPPRVTTKTRQISRMEDDEDDKE